MAEQSGERRVTEEVGADLISLIVPDIDLEFVQLVLSRTTRSAAGGEPQAALLREYAELLALIRDVGIDRAQLHAILGLNPETLPAGDDNPHPPIR
jgi:hypothetical protein